MNDPLLLLALAAALLWLAYVFIRPKLLVVVSLFFCTFQLNWFHRYSGSSRILSRIGLAFVGILAVRVVLDLLFGRRRKIAASGFPAAALKLAMFILLLTLLSGIYNGESLVLGVFNLRYYFAGLVFCFAVYLHSGPSLSIRLLKRILVYVALLQIPVSIVKFIVAGGGLTRTLDSVTGTFSSYGELVACQVLSIGLLLYDRFCHGRNILRWNSYLVAALLTVPLLLSKSRMATAFVLAAILFAGALSTFRRKNIALTVWNMILVAVLGLAAVGLFYHFFWRDAYDIEEQTDPEYIQSYFMRESTGYGRMGRWRAITASFSLISDNPVNLLAGYGSGAASEASLIGRQGSYYEETGPLAGLDSSQLSTSTMEFGLAGIAALLAFVFSVYRKLRRMKGPASAESVEFYLVFLFTLALLSWYTMTLGSFFFSILFGVFLGVSQTEQDRARLPSGG